MALDEVLDEVLASEGVRSEAGGVGDAAEAGKAAAGRKRRYSSPGRQESVMVKYTERERSVVGRAAEATGLQVRRGRGGRGAACRGGGAGGAGAVIVA